jgi:DNA repair exonuclease SbcCD ATPase subunit
MSTSKDLENRIRELFRHVFLANCLIEDSSMTKEEAETINQIDILDLAENLKEIVTELLEFKKEFATSDKAELVKRTEQFEIMLQKLEAEVRTHIRVEHQLKLHIETNQSHNDDLIAQNAKHLNDIKELQEKIKNFTRPKPEKKDHKEFIEKIEKLEETLKKKDAVILKLETELKNFKSFADENDKIIIKKSRGKNGEEFEEIKQKFQEKAVGLQKLQKLIREKSSKTTKERNRNLRKSINDSDIIRNKIADVKITSKIFGKSHMRSTSEQVRPKSVGIRPPSR